MYGNKHREKSCVNLPQQAQKAAKLGSCVNFVQGYECGDESGRNPLEISAEFSHSNIPAQIDFVNAFEWTQVISDSGPHAFSRVRMNFSKTIAIIVSRPFVLCMANGFVFSKDVVV